jgi:signal transduction histidine kinase
VAIVLLMMAVDLIVVWQFRQMAIPSERLAQADQTSLAIVRVHLDVDTFRDDVARLASTHDTQQFSAAAARFREKFREDVRQAQLSLSTLPGTAQNPAILSALEAVQLTLLSQLDTSAELAAAGDWSALRLRFADQVQSLIQLSSVLMEKVERVVSQQRAEALESTQHARRQLLAVLPVTALLTLAFAIGLGWSATRAITDPLKELDAGAQALARREFHHEVVVAGEDELATLGRAFNYATGELRELYDGLRESEARYRRIFQGAGVSIWEEDFSQVKAALDDLRACGVRDFRQYLAAHPEFVGQAASLVRVVDVNDATVKLLAAKSKQELVGSLDREFLAEAEEVIAGELLALWDGRTFFESEAVLRTLRGDRVAVLLTITFPPQHAKFDSVLVSTMDITERKRAEESLAEAQAELAHLTRMMTMGELAASIAHEVNQPLTAIITNANASLRLLAARPPDLGEAREAIHCIVSDGNRASEVIKRIRALLKKTPPQKTPLNINEAIGEVIALAQAEVRRNRVALTADLTADLPPVLADRVQLQQVLLNLMLNGIEAMHAVTDRPRTLLVRTQRDEAGQLTVAVQDSGMGIQPQNMGRLFDAFYTTKAEGMGMGLAISRSIIEAHGGRLWAEANSGYGATFQFTLPANVRNHHNKGRHNTPIT